MLVNMSLTDFLNETASSSPAPGGGSVSALAASLSASLTSMVCRLTIGKKKYADVEERMKEVLAKAEEARNGMQDLIDEDTRAFQQVMNAFALPKGTDDEKRIRSESIQHATKNATAVPMTLVRSCATLVSLVEAVAKDGNRNSQSDAGVAALLLSAAVRGAAMNVYINLGGLTDEGYVAEVGAQCRAAEKEVTDRCEAVAREIREALAA